MSVHRLIFHRTNSLASRSRAACLRQKNKKNKKSAALTARVNLLCVDIQSAQESSEVQNELSEKVDRLKAEIVVFKSLMSDVSISMECCHQQFPRLV